MKYGTCGHTKDGKGYEIRTPFWFSMVNLHSQAPTRNGGMLLGQQAFKVIFVTFILLDLRLLSALVTLTLVRNYVNQS